MHSIQYMYVNYAKINGKYIGVILAAVSLIYMLDSNGKKSLYIPALTMMLSTMSYSAFVLKN